MSHPITRSKQLTIQTLTTLLLLVGLSSCGDLVNEPSAPNPPPPTETKKPEVIPEPPKPTHSTQYLDEMCERERQWVYSTGAIDATQLRLFRKRNLAPVYNMPGERQSGIESWFQCALALKMNGFHQ